MTPPGRLALRVAPPQDEEPAYGVFCRLAARHRHQDARVMARKVRYPFKEIVSGIHREGIERLAGAPDGILAGSTVMHEGYDAVIGGLRLYRNDWVVKPSRICPGCVREDLRSPDPGVVPHRRFWWDYRSIETCPRHSCRLEAGCGRCGNDYPAWRTDLTRCPCGAPLEHQAVAEVQPDLARADRYILARLLDTARPPVPILDGIPLRHLQSTLLTIGAPLASAVRTINTGDMAVRLEAKAAAFRIFEGWPEAFRTMLDGLRTTSAAMDGHRARARTPYRLYQFRIKSTLNRDGQWPIMDEYEQHFLRNVPAGGVGRIFGRPMLDNEHLTLRAANDALGLTAGSRRLLPVLLDLGLIKTGTEFSRGLPIPRRMLPSLRTAVDGRLGLHTAARRLGVSQNTLTMLVRLGHLPIVQNEYDEGRRMSGSSIEAFVAKLARDAPLRTDLPGDLVELAKAARRPPGFDGIIREIQAGGIGVVARLHGCEGLDGLLLKRTDIVALRFRASRRSPGPEVHPRC